MICSRRRENFNWTSNRFWPKEDVRRRQYRSLRRAVRSTVHYSVCTTTGSLIIFRTHGRPKDFFSQHLRSVTGSDCYVLSNGVSVGCPEKGVAGDAQNSTLYVCVALYTSDQLLLWDFLRGLQELIVVSRRPTILVILFSFGGQSPTNSSRCTL